MRDYVKDPEKWFHCKSGRELKSIEDFKEALKNEYKNQDRNAFKFHSSNNNNDFANWIKIVLQAPELAEKIRNIQSPEETLKIIEEETAALEERNVDVVEETEIPIDAEENKEKGPESQDVDINDIKQRAKYYSELSDKMEERVRSMKKRSKTAPKQTSEMVEKIEDKYKKVYEEISEERKAGKDMFIPYLKIRNIQPKIEYLKVTQNKKDFEAIEKLLEQIEEDILDAKEHKEPNLKEEVMEIVHQEKDATEEVN